jgi:hypothetical protein
MAENLNLSALRNKAVSHVGDTFEDQLFVDFSANNLASGDEFKLFNVPKGAVITEIGWVTHVTDAQNPTFALTGVDGTSTGEAIITATAIGAAYAAVIAHDTSPVIFASDAGYVKCVGGTATNDAGKVTFFIKGFVAKRQS